jgi:drug/metabolite transporter (DMT)-like permease
MSAAAVHPHSEQSALKAVGLSVIAAFFFSLTFVMNRMIGASGGHWSWAVVLRYLFMLVFLGGTLAVRGGFGKLIHEVRRHPAAWITWSVIGFGVFGSLITWASARGPAWLVAGVFQSTVILGPLQAPLIYKDERRHIAPRVIFIGLLIFAGVLAMQFSRATALNISDTLISLAAVLVAAAVWPLGNRKVMTHLEECGAKITVTERVFGMTLLSMLLYLPLGLYTLLTVGPPNSKEVLLGGSIALSSGVIATGIFYRAMESVRHSRVGLAAVEAMQACGLLFSIFLGASFLGEAWPTGLGAIGAAMVILGIVLFSLLSAQKRK